MEIIAFILTILGTVFIAIGGADLKERVDYPSFLLIFAGLFCISSSSNIRMDVAEVETATAYCFYEVQEENPGWAELSNADLLAAVQQVQPAVDVDVEALHQQCFEELQKLSISTES